MSRREDFLEDPNATNQIKFMEKKLYRVTFLWSQNIYSIWDYSIEVEARDEEEALYFCVKYMKRRLGEDVFNLDTENIGYEITEIKNGEDHKVDVKLKIVTEYKEKIKEVTDE